MYSVELKQASDVDDQYIISVSTQSVSKGKKIVFHTLIIIRRLTNCKCLHQVEQSEFGKSEEETFRCAIQKQTFIDEVLIVEDVGDVKRNDEVLFFLFVVFTSSAHKCMMRTLFCHFDPFFPRMQ